MVASILSSLNNIFNRVVIYLEGRKLVVFCLFMIGIVVYGYFIHSFCLEFVFGCIMYGGVEIFKKLGISREGRSVLRFGK